MASWRRTRPCRALGDEQADNRIIKTQQDIYEDPQSGDVLVITDNRIDARDQAQAPGSTVIVRFRARAMWARIIEFVPGEGHRVELLIAVHELAATGDGQP